MCIPNLVTTFPEWLSGTQPLPHTPGAMRPSVLVVFVVFCVYMHSFAALIRWTPPPTFSDSAITDRHSDTSIFQLRAHWVRISWSIGSEKSFGRFFRSNRPGYPHLVSSELENSGTIVLGQKNCSNFFFRSNRPGYPHPVSSELENSGIRVWYTMIVFCCCFFFGFLIKNISWYTLESP